MDLAKIKESETSMEYWKDESLLWWRMYLRNVMMLRKLRKENRHLRILLSDYVNK